MNSFHSLTKYPNFLKNTKTQTCLLKHNGISSTFKPVMKCPGSLGQVGTFSASD